MPKRLILRLLVVCPEVGLLRNRGTGHGLGLVLLIEALEKLLGLLAPGHFRGGRYVERVAREVLQFVFSPHGEREAGHAGGIKHREAALRGIKKLALFG